VRDTPEGARRSPELLLDDGAIIHDPAGYPEASDATRRCP
jgi:hypothetical protein